MADPTNQFLRHLQIDLGLNALRIVRVPLLAGQTLLALGATLVVNTAALVVDLDATGGG